MWLGICLALTPVHQLRRAGTKPARSPVVAAEQGEAYAEAKPTRSPRHAYAERSCAQWLRRRPAFASPRLRPRYAEAKPSPELQLCKVLLQ